MLETTIKSLLSTLSADDKKSLIEILSRDVLKVDYDGISHTLTTNVAKCPHCGSYHIIKKGLQKGKQKFRCKDCSKWFSIRTNTPLENSKKPVEIWSQYLNLMMDGLSLRAIAKEMNINLKTAFLWRHKILSFLQSFTSHT